MNALAQIKAAKIASDRPIVDLLMLKFPCPISVNAMYANVPGKGRIRTRAYEQWRQEAMTEILRQRPGRIAGPYGVALTVRRVSLRRDLDGLVKGAVDLLVTMGVCDDDRHLQHLEATWSDDESLIGVECRLWSEPRA